MADDPVTMATETVRQFLRLMEARDLDAAAAFVGPDVEITFPGRRVFTTLEQQVESSGGRFRHVRKEFERFDVVAAGDADDLTVVYAFGTLTGEGPDGAEFEGVRFIDRFTLRAGRIVDQKVWNDLAEEGIVPGGRTL